MAPMNPIPLSAPFRGENDLIPLVNLENPFCESILNFNLDDGNLILRHGDSEYGSKTTRTIIDLAAYGVGTGEKLLTITDNGANISIYNNTTPGAPIGIYSVVATGDRNIQSLYFAGSLIFFGELTLTPAGAGNLYYNGISGNIALYTYTSITPFGGDVYKNRAYLIGYQSTKYAYTNINAVPSVASATTEVDLAQIISNKGFLYCIVPMSVTEGSIAGAVQCFIFNTGEVLVYGGSYPNGADWTMLATFQIPAPVNYNAVVRANGDKFIITKSALISMRALLTQGVDVATRQGISNPISKRWDQIFQSTVSFNGMKAIYDSAKDRIVIVLPNYVDRTGAVIPLYGMRLVYSFRTESWTEQKIAVASSGIGYYGSSTYFNDNVLCAGQNSNNGGIMIMEGATGYVDAQPDSATAIVYSYDVTSAPIPGGRTYASEIQGLDIIMTSDLYAQTDYQLVGDLGRVTTTAQKLPSDSLTSLQKPNVNVGLGDCTYIQYRISGTTAAAKTVGLNIFGLNAWLQEGTVPR